MIIIKIFTDGSGFNGIKSRFVVAPEIGKPIIQEVLEKKTNNEMEYTAVITALGIATNYDTILTDSMLVVNQVKGIWSCNFEHLILLRDRVKELAKQKHIKLKWIPRHKNLAGIMLERIINKSKIQTTIQSQ